MPGHPTRHRSRDGRVFWDTGTARPQPRSSRGRAGPGRAGERGADSAPGAPSPAPAPSHKADPERGYVAARTWVRGASLGSALTGGGSLFSAECERNKILLKGR